MELTYIPGVDVGDMSVRPFSMGDRLPGKRFFRLPLLAKATVAGNYPLLLAATLVMVLVVLLINRLFWRRLYALAEEKYRMEV